MSASTPDPEVRPGAPETVAPETVVTLRRLGTVPYAEALALQRRIVQQMRDDPSHPEHLLLLEHPPVFTIGRSARANHLLAGADRLRREGIEVHPTNRGGDITYHGPGQLVAYPLLRLDRRGRGPRAYLRQLEQVVIEALAAYNIESGRSERFTGVWTCEKKICAIGIAVTRWVSWHGFALNVTTNLNHFALIVPCGIADAGVTSIEQELGRPVAMEEVMKRVERAFEKVFECRLQVPAVTHPEPR